MQTRGSKRIGISENGESSNVHYFFISLYMVILAFFILLNNISVINQQRQKDALGSVHKTFSDGSNFVLSVDGIFSSGGNLPSISNYFSSVASIAKDEFSLVDTDILEFGDHIQITLPVSELFEDDSYEISRNKKGFITRLSREISTLNQNTRVEVEFVFNNDSTAGGESAAIPPNVYRSGVLARTLINFGVPEKNIIIGLEHGKEGKVAMNFYRRDINEIININY